MTSFTDRLEQYLAFRRRYGGDWTVAAQNLRPFVVFADAEGAGWLTVDLLLFRTLFDDGFPGLFHAIAARISDIIRSLPERRAGAHSV